MDECANIAVYINQTSVVAKKILLMARIGGVGPTY